jgi:hypothetical protein
VKQVERAQLHDIHHRVDISGSGEENRGHVFAGGAQCPYQARAVEVRHTDVHEQTFGCVGTEVVEKSARARERTNAASSRRQQTADGGSDGGIVIDDRYEGSFVTHAQATV